MSESYKILYYIFERFQFLFLWLHTRQDEVVWITSSFHLYFNLYWNGSRHKTALLNLLSPTNLFILDKVVQKMKLTGFLSKPVDLWLSLTKKDAAIKSALQKNRPRTQRSGSRPTAKECLSWFHIIKRLFR